MSDHTEEKSRVGRRDFLKLGAAGLALIVGPKVISSTNGHASSAAGGEGSAHRWAMVIDLAKCTGCGHCRNACQAHNDCHPDIAWNRVMEYGEVNGDMIQLPVQCQHCEDAACVHICPVKATYQRPDGIVMMNYDRCIGCRYCEMACPYAARYFNWEDFDEKNPMVPEWGHPEVARRPRGVVEKCSFCYHRIDRGLEQGLTPGVDMAATPACVVACPTGARVFGDLNDPESPASQVLAQNDSFQLREDMGTKPRIFYLPARNGTQFIPQPEETTTISEG